MSLYFDVRLGMVQQERIDFLSRFLMTYAMGNENIWKAESCLRSWRLNA